MGRERVLRTYGHHRKRLVVAHDSANIFDTKDESHCRIFSTSSSESGFGPSESVDSTESFNYTANHDGRKAKNKALQKLKTGEENHDPRPNKRKRQPRGKQAFIFASDKDSCPSSSSESFTPASKRAARPRRALNDVSNSSSGPAASIVNQRVNRRRQAEKKTAAPTKEQSSHSAYNFSEFDDYSLVISDSPLVTGDAQTSAIPAGGVMHGTSTPCQSDMSRAVSTLEKQQVDLSHISPLAATDVEDHDESDLPAGRNQSAASVSPASPSLYDLRKNPSVLGLTESSCVGSEDESRDSTSSDVENIQRLENSFASLRVNHRRPRRKPVEAELSKHPTDCRQPQDSNPVKDDHIFTECKGHIQKLRENLLKKKQLLQAEVSVQMQEKFDGSCSLFETSETSILHQPAKSTRLQTRAQLDCTDKSVDESGTSGSCSESDTGDSDTETSESGGQGPENLSAIDEDEEIDEESDETDSEEEEEDNKDGGTDVGVMNGVSGRSTKGNETLDDSRLSSPVRYMLTSTSYLAECDSPSQSQENSDKGIHKTHHACADPLDKSDNQVIDLSCAVSNEMLDEGSPVRYLLTSTSYLTNCDSLSHSQLSHGDDSILDHSSKLASTPAKASRSFGEVLTPSRKEAGDGHVLQLSPRSRVLEQCDQDAPLPFSAVIPPSVMKKCVKIGEGVYGEVFRTTRGGSSVALKIIPIEGDFDVNDEPQKTFAEILPEIVISNELSGLREGSVNSTYNFCPVRSVSCVQGSYPAELLKQWDLFHEKKTSENDRPDVFGPEQLYIMFEFGDGGSDLDSCKLKSGAEGVSILQQVACALAVAEAEMKFEHRDLHVGNVLVQPTDDATVTVTLDGTPIFIDTHGVRVNIIDFTLSRLTKDGCTVFCDLATDDTLFEGKGDYQFDIYRMMKKENKNKWEPFHPHTNVMWLHYLCDKLINRKRYAANDRSHRESMKRLRQASQNLLQYQSAAHFVLEDAFFES